MDIIGYQIMNQACIPAMNPTWSYFKVFLYYWILFVNILLRIFTFIFMRHIWYLSVVFIFLCVLFFYSFGIRVTLALENELGNVPSSSSIFRKRLYRIDVNSSLNVCYNSPVTAFELGKFFYYVLIHFLKQL